MQISDRMIRILKIMHGEDRFYTAKEIANQLEVSSRTVREEIYKNIDELKKLGFEITSQSNRGYKMQINKSNLNEMNCNLNAIEEYSFENNRDDKEIYMLRQLLSTNEWVKLDDLCEQMWISKSTINRLLKTAKLTLEEYDLKIVSKPSYGVKIEGDEFNKRLCFLHCCFDENSDRLEYILKFNDIDDVKKDKIIETVLEVLKNESFILTENGYQQLIIHLMYTIYRIQINSTISSLYLSHFEESGELQKSIAEKIIRQLENLLDIQIPDEEIGYIAIHLTGKGMDFNGSQIVVDEKTEQIVKKVNRRINDELGYDFSSDFDLFSAISYHMQTMLVRLRYGLNLANPILPDIKVRMSNGFDCAVVAADEIKTQLNYEICEDELGYLAIHYSLAIERLNELNNTKYVVICGTGMGTAMLIKRKVQKQFKAKSENIQLIDYRAGMHFDYRNVDYVITSIKINYPIPKKVIYLENILGDFEFEDLSESSLNSILPEELTYLNVKVDNVKQLLEMMCLDIKKYCDVDDNFYELVLQREEISTTEIGNMVAIPHPFSLASDQTLMSISILDKPLQWKRKKVKYVFLVAYNRNSINDSLTINEKLFSKITDTKWLNALEKVTEIQELRQLLK